MQNLAHASGLRCRCAVSDAPIADVPSVALASCPVDPPDFAIARKIERSGIASHSTSRAPANLAAISRSLASPLDTRCRRSAPRSPPSPAAATPPAAPRGSGAGAASVTVTSRNRSDKHRHLFGEQHPPAFEIPHVAGEALNLRQVVRREKNGRLRRALQQALDQLIAHQRVQPGKRLVQHDQRGPVRQRARERRLHPHAARQVLQLAVQRQIELPHQLLLEPAVPRRIKRPHDNPASLATVIASGRS